MKNLLKNFIAALLVVLMLFSLSACKNEDNNLTDDSNSQISTTIPSSGDTDETKKNDAAEVEKAFTAFCDAFNKKGGKYDEVLSFKMESPTTIKLIITAYNVPAADTKYITNLKKTVLSDIAKFMQDYRFPESMNVSVSASLKTKTEQTESTSNQSQPTPDVWEEKDGLWGEVYYYFHK